MKRILSAKKTNSKCYRCLADIKVGLPPPGMSRFSAKVLKYTWQIRYSYVRMNTWNNAPTAADVIDTSWFTEVDLCDDCWGDVLNFICTTKKEGNSG